MDDGALGIGTAGMGHVAMVHVLVGHAFVAIPTPIGIGWSIGIDWEISGPTKIISMANRASHAPMPCRFRVVATCDSRRLE